ncbi:hypothetical protein [Lysobacter capsici]|uniref:hypothetical protein n=1 Tax=Lysobacter capsici TaxID=435897 RepID=UPI001C005BE1|nr:hypothetical protein [Lysobacter capsici]MBW8810945.1 hypothetical protein [Lysobacter sp.]QWF19354.1 hypothetical protein KME82_11730 [Lysobacter capsici]
MSRKPQMFGSSLSRSSLGLSSLGLMLAIAPAAHAQKDRQVYDAAIARSAEVCPDHSAERTRPGVTAVPAASLKALEERKIALCPDRRLDSTTPVVWYGREGVFAWNPSAGGVGKLLAGKVTAQVRSGEFPSQTVVWKANGKLAEGALVPAFRRK